jgi:hypothetical protein
MAARTKVKYISQPGELDELGQTGARAVKLQRSPAA